MAVANVDAVDTKDDNLLVPEASSRHHHRKKKNRLKKVLADSDTSLVSLGAEEQTAAKTSSPNQQSVYCVSDHVNKPSMNGGSDRRVDRSEENGGDRGGLSVSGRHGGATVRGGRGANGTLCQE